MEIKKLKKKNVECIFHQFNYRLRILIAKRSERKRKDILYH